MTILMWIVVGGIAGWLASLVMKSPLGIIGDIAVGIIGAFIGESALTLLGVQAGMSGINAVSIFTAFVGACILLFLLRLISQRNG